MPTWQARLFRFLLKHWFGRRFWRGVLPAAELGKLDDLMTRSQRPPQGTSIQPVTAGGCAAEWVRGPGATPGAAALYFHGGAFVMGSPATHRELAARISMAAQAPVLALDYRLAPDFPFPAALEDAKAAYRWLLGEGYAPKRLVIGGDSSGGGLALQALLSLRDDGVPLPCGAFFLSPVTDWVAFDGESYTTRAALDPLVSLAQCRYTASLYAASHAQEEPLLRPAEMELAGLPAMWIHVGDCEVLLSDAQRLAERAARAGVDVTFKIWPGMWHISQTAARFVPEAQQSMDELAHFLRGRLAA